MNQEFEDGIVNLLRDSATESPALNDATNLSGMDSLAVTEACILVEEHFGLEISFEDFKKLETYGELKALIESKK